MSVEEKVSLSGIHARVKEALRDSGATGRMKVFLNDLDQALEGQQFFRCVSCGFDQTLEGAGMPAPEVIRIEVPMIPAPPKVKPVFSSVCTQCAQPKAFSDGEEFNAHMLEHQERHHRERAETEAADARTAALSQVPGSQENEVEQAIAVKQAELRSYKRRLELRRIEEELAQAKADLDGGKIILETRADETRIPGAGVPAPWLGSLTGAPGSPALAPVAETGGGAAEGGGAAAAPPAGDPAGNASETGKEKEKDTHGGGHRRRH